MKFVALAVAFCVSSVAVADTIVARLTVPNPEVALGPPGALVSVPAPVVVFTATGDTSNIFSYAHLPPPDSYAFRSPVHIDIPGVISFVSNLEGSHVATQTLLPTYPGIFGWRLREVLTVGSLGISIVEPRIGGYDFRTSLPPLSVVAQAYDNAPPRDSRMYFTIPDGRTLSIRMIDLPATLEVEVTSVSPIPVHSPIAVAMLVIAILAASITFLRVHGRAWGTRPD